MDQEIELKRLRFFLKISEEIEDSTFLDQYLNFLIEEYEERGKIFKSLISLDNQTVKKVLYEFENDASKLFQKSELICFLLTFIKYKEILKVLFCPFMII